MSVTIRAMRVGDIGLIDYTVLGLQAALDYVSVGGGQVYVGPGTIALAATISISSKTWLCGAGIGATILQRGAGMGSTNCLQNKNFTGAADTDILISDMSIDGNASGGVGLCCIRFTNVTRGTVRACALKNYQAEGVAVYGNGAGPGVNVDIKIDGCQFSGGIDSAIDVQDVNGLAVSGFCQFRNMGHSAINLEPNAATDQCIGVSFSGNSVAAGTSPFSVVVQGDHSAGVQGVIRNCAFSGNSFDGGDVGAFFAGSNLDGVVFAGNSLTNQNKQAFYALNAHGITTGVDIVGNFVRNASTAGIGSYSAMEFTACQKISVNENRIQDDRIPFQVKYGIEFNGGSTNNWFYWNSIDGSTVGDIAPDVSPHGSFRTWGVYDHAGLMHVRNDTVRYRGTLQRTATAFNVVGYDDTGAVYHPVAIQTAALIRFALTDAATIAVDASLGNLFTVTLAGNRTMGTPTNSYLGQPISFKILQDGTGGRTLAWNAVFKTAWVDTGNTLNKFSTIDFWYDGANWIQDGAQSPYI